MKRAKVSETVAMRISGHKTRAIFDRYDIVDEGDLETAGAALTNYFTDRKEKRAIKLELVGDGAALKRQCSRPSSTLQRMSAGSAVPKNTLHPLGEGGADSFPAVCFKLPNAWQSDLCGRVNAYR
jgi:hypothetical protein